MATFPGKLRVLPRGTGMVPDYESQMVRRFHGWRHDPTLGHDVPITKGMQPARDGSVTQKSGAFVKLEATRPEHVIELPVTTEYLRHLREGSLWPADEATAQEAQCPYDPAFGGEHPLGAAQQKLPAVTVRPTADTERA
jgi:hypothetical protein